MPSTDAMKTLLASAFPDARVEVSDLTGTQDHFQATVVTRAKDSHRAAPDGLRRAR
jgi:hypothetical protein